MLIPPGEMVFNLSATFDFENPEISHLKPMLSATKLYQLSHLVYYRLSKFGSLVKRPEQGDPEITVVLSNPANRRINAHKNVTSSNSIS